MKPLKGGVAMHLACHARAQNIGPKSAELLRYIPEAEVTVIERCSGHGGTFGVMKETHDIAMKIGKPAGRLVAKSNAETVCSDCPLAAKHLVQVIDGLDTVENPPEAAHPIEVFARAYNLI